MTKRKTIIIYLWNMDIGGVQKRVNDIILFLTKYYPHYKIILLLKNGYFTPLLNKIKRLPLIKVYCLSQNKKGCPVFGWSFIWLIRIIIKYKPDVVLTFLIRLSIQMAIVKKILFWKKYKLILNEAIFTTNHIKIYENSSPYPLNFIRFLIKIFYPMAGIIIVPTKTIKNDLIKNFNVPCNKIKIVPHWIIKRQNSELKPCNKIYDFIFIGRLEKEKNVWWLIDLIKYLHIQYPNISLCILGKGSLEKEFLKQIKENKLANYFNYAGFQADIVPYLKKSKILLLPSQNEGMPNCVLEAASLFVPAVINNFPGACEVVINNQTGLITYNKKEFIKQCQNLLVNTSLRKQMGFRAYKLSIKKFGENNLENFVNILI